MYCYMRRIVSFIYFFVISITILAQSQYDYMDDDAVAGGTDRVLNAFIILFLIVIAFVVIAFIFGGIAKIKYELSPQKEIDRQKKEKEEREKQERIKKAEEHRKALLALPEKSVRLVIQGRPQIVELARLGNRINTEMLAICMWTIDDIIWEGTHITDEVGSIDKSIDFIYGDFYKSKWQNLPMCELIVSKHCVDLAQKSSELPFGICFTIRGDFDPHKLQIIHHKHEGLRHHNVSRDIKCLEFLLYDGDIIQTHLAIGNPLCFPYEGYNSYPNLNDRRNPTYLKW